MLNSGTSWLRETIAAASYFSEESLENNMHFRTVLLSRLALDPYPKTYNFC